MSSTSIGAAAVRTAAHHYQRSLPLLRRQLPAAGVAMRATATQFGPLTRIGYKPLERSLLQLERPRLAFLSTSSNEQKIPVPDDRAMGFIAGKVGETMLARIRSHKPESGGKLFLSKQDSGQIVHYVRTCLKEYIKGDPRFLYKGAEYCFTDDMGLPIGSLSYAAERQDIRLTGLIPGYKIRLQPQAKEGDLLFDLIETSMDTKLETTAFSLGALEKRPILELLTDWDKKLISYQIAKTVVNQIFASSDPYPEEERALIFDAYLHDVMGALENILSSRLEVFLEKGWDLTVQRLPGYKLHIAVAEIDPEKGPIFKLIEKWESKRVWRTTSFSIPQEP